MEKDFWRISYFKLIAFKIKDIESYKEKIYYTYKNECKLFIHESFQNYSIYPQQLIEDEVDIVWKFDGSQKSLDQWIVNSDSDYKHGYSSAK